MFGKQAWVLAEQREMCVLREMQYVKYGVNRLKASYYSAYSRRTKQVLSTAHSLNATLVSFLCRRALSRVDEHQPRSNTYTAKRYAQAAYSDARDFSQHCSNTVFKKSDNL